MSVNGEMLFELSFDVVQNFIREKLRYRYFEKISYVQKIKKIFCLDNRVYNVISRLEDRKIFL